MGGALTLRLGADHPEIAGLICINPAHSPSRPEVIAMLTGDGRRRHEVVPGIGSDIADPDAHRERLRRDAACEPLLSLLVDGAGRTGADVSEHAHAAAVPRTRRRTTSSSRRRPSYLAEHYGGPVERVTLERSYHVATQDFDKQLIFDRSRRVRQKVTAS